MKIPIWVRRWNKKIHIYLGLYMLLFLWLFSISGLLINHHNWFQDKYEKPIQLPQGADDQAKAEDLRVQLGLSGEILRVRGNRMPPRGHFTFNLDSLEKVISVDADLEKSVATIQHRPKPKQDKYEKPIQLPQGADYQAKTEDLRAQLGLSGRFSGPGATESLLPAIAPLLWWVSTGICSWMPIWRSLWQPSSTGPRLLAL